MKLNRLLAIATTLALGASVFTATSATAATSGDYDYTVDGGNATITGYTGFGGAIDIPATVSDNATSYPVTAIGDTVFSEKGLTAVNIPDSVTTIGANAFNFNQLTSITIPDSVTTFGDGVFGNNQLTSITIGSRVTTIGEYAFGGNQLTSVTIPNSVTSIGVSAFYGNQLTSITIPDSVTSIGRSAFNSNQLTSVTIGSSVTTIGDYAFANSQITSVTIPNSVTSIGVYAFQRNRLTSVTIGSSVTTIGDYAFNRNLLTSVTIGSSVTSIGKSAFHSNLLTSVTIPNSVTSIGRNAFYSNLLTSVTIGSSVTSIGAAAFGGNTTLASALFLGNAPATITAAGSNSSFDTTNTDFRVSFTYGATGFGTDPTWRGYALTQPSEPPVTSSSNMTAGVTAGVRSVNLGLATFTSVPYSHAVQTVNTTATLSVNDLTGAGVGWNVTLTSSALTWTASSGGPASGSDLLASALALTTVGSVTTAAGNAWDGNSSATGALNSPVKVLSTSGGNGSYTTPLTLTLTVPGQASVGTYAGTLTTTISAAP